MISDKFPVFPNEPDIPFSLKHTSDWPFTLFHPLSKTKMLAW